MTVTTDQAHQQGHRPEEVEIEINYRGVRVPREVTGLQILQAAHLETTFELFRIRGEDEIPIGNDEQIVVHAGEKFVATPGLEPA